LSAKRTSSTKRKPSGKASLRSRVEQNGRTLDRVKKALESTEKELTAVGGSVVSGDLRKGASKLLREARREVEKMSKAVSRDVERLQKDLAAAGKGKPAAKKAKPKKAKARKTTRAKAASKAGAKRKAK
jgi:hypothetical protein